MTFIRKDVRGNWKADDDLDIGDKRRLKVSTFKRSNGNLVTTATVATVDGVWESHALYVDFSRTLEVSSPKRITSKAVEIQHGKHPIESIKEEALAFYKGK